MKAIEIYMHVACCLICTCAHESREISVGIALLLPLFLIEREDLLSLLLYIQMT